MADIFSRPIQIDAELSPQGTLTAELTPNETLDGELSIPREVIGNYETLRNKPSINDVELTGNKTSSDLGLASATHTHTKSDITDFTHTHTTDEITDFPTLAEVATSGDYDDLSNKPNLSAVATSGDYGDLSNRPNIPANTSDLTNDSGFISQETDPTVPAWAKQETKPTYTAQEVGALPDDTVIPSKTSDLDNDEGFITADDIPETVTDTIAANNAKINHLTANKADIDAANITSATIREAWIDQLMVQTGLLANSGTIYTLDAIQVNASNITAGTIDVERLIVTVNGEKYLIHIDPNTSQPVYEKLNGNIIQPNTITADRIVANSITTQQITTQNLVGTNGWINLANGTFFYGNGADWATSTTGIVWDGTDLKIKGNVTITGGNVYTQTQVDDMVSDSTYMVAIEVVSINYQTPNCTLKARVFKEGVELSDLTGLTFNWTKNASQTSLGTSQTLTTTDLDSIYICTIS